MLTLKYATVVFLFAIIIELPIADVAEGTVYNAVSVVANGLVARGSWSSDGFAATQTFRPASW